MKEKLEISNEELGGKGKVRRFNLEGAMPSSRWGENLPVATNAANICGGDACIVPRTGHAI